MINKLNSDNYRMLQILKQIYQTQKWQNNFINNSKRKIRMPNTNPYEVLRDRLITLYTLNDYQWFEALVSLPLSGDQKPSHLMITNRGTVSSTSPSQNPFSSSPWEGIPVPVGSIRSMGTRQWIAGNHVPCRKTSSPAGGTPRITCRFSSSSFHSRGDLLFLPHLHEG